MLRGLRVHDTCEGVSPGVHVPQSARVHESLVSPGVLIGDRASVVHSVLLAGATVGDGAQVTGSTVMGVVGAGATLTDCVIGADGSVAAGEVVTSERRPDPTSS
jgi:ADP-glucose pyrophosphorylase